MDGKKRIAPDSEGYALFSLPRFLEDQKQLGYRTVSLWGGSPHIFVDCYGYENPTEIKNLMQGYGISPVSYRPQAYGYTLCAKKSSLLWTSSLDYYRFSAELASKLTAPLMVMSIGGILRDQGRGWQDEAAVDGVRLVARECENQGILLAVIPGTAESGALLNSLTDVERFLMRAENGNVKAAFDAGAARGEHESLTDWFRVFGANLCHARTDREAQAFLQEFDETGYQGYYECSSSPPEYLMGIHSSLGKGGREDGWKQ